MTDVEYAMMAENVATFRRRIVDFLRSEQGWPCACCGQERQPPADGWWGANDVRDATDSHGPSGMAAINRLVAEGVLEMDPRLRVRLASRSPKKGTRPMTETIQAGRCAEDIVEAGGGGEYHRALILAELDSAAYGVEEEFAYDISEPATDLLRMVRDLRAHLERLSVTKDASLSLHRVCSACGGDGKDWRLQEPERSMNPCEDCDGRGYDEKDSDA